MDFHFRGFNIHLFPLGLLVTAALGVTGAWLGIRGLRAVLSRRSPP